MAHEVFVSVAHEVFVCQWVMRVFCVSVGHDEVFVSVGHDEVFVSVGHEVFVCQWVRCLCQ